MLVDASGATSVECEILDEQVSFGVNVAGVVLVNSGVAIGVDCVIRGELVIMEVVFNFHANVFFCLCRWR